MLSSDLLSIIKNLTRDKNLVSIFLLYPQNSLLSTQRAKEVVSDSQGLVNSVINLPGGQVKSFVEFKLQKNCEINLLIKTFFGLVEMMFGLVNVSFSLPKWQAVKMTFFAPCFGVKLNT